MHNKITEPTDVDAALVQAVVRGAVTPPVLSGQ